MITQHAKGVDCKHPHFNEVIRYSAVNCPACKRILRTDTKIKEAFDKYLEDYKKKVKEESSKRGAPEYGAAWKQKRKPAKTESGRKGGVHIKRCPECNSWMKIKENNKTGDKFLGCTNYPHCTHTAKIKQKERPGILSFGKHKGKHFKDIPFNYLRWLAEQNFCPASVKAYVKKHKDFI